MLTRIASGAAAVLFALTVAASADEPFGTGVWLASPKLCEEAKAAGSLKKTLDDGNLVLSAKGLRGADFLCHFVQVLKAPDVDAWVATALCRQEGAGDFPNVYSISKGADGRLTLVTVYDDEEPAADGGDVPPEDAAPSGDPATPPVTSQPDGTPAAPAAAGDQAGTATEADDVSVGDVYSLCQGVPAP